ncbi:MAG: phage integrase SAM-like domain-containing protein [Bacteroidota bacterium]
MSTSVTLSLDRRRPKKDGSCPIVLRLSHGKRTINIQSGYDVQEKYWDDNNRKIRTACPTIDNVTRANNILIKKKAEAVDLINDLDEQKLLASYSTTDLKKKILGKSSGITFYQYCQQIIDELVNSNRIGNARNYRNVLREIKKFKSDVDFKIKEINYHFLKDFENYYLGKGLSVNGLSVYLRTIRAIYNRAIKDQLVDKSTYPFDGFAIKNKPTRKRSISFESINKIIELKFEESDGLFLARNLFLASFYMMGAPFIDLAFLKRNNITDQRIKYTRRKTGKFYDIKLSEQLRELLNYYIKDKQPDDFIFPIIKSEDLEKQYDEILWALQRHNKRLKSIATKAGIEEKLTSYVSRHSFASLANNMKIPVTAISEMLGHTSLKTTQVYLSGLNKDVIDDYNERIIKGGE